MPLSNKRKLINDLLIPLGVFFDALGTCAFILPYNFVAGGVTGIGRIFHHYLHFEISYVIGFFSLLLLLAGWLTLGRRFAMTIIAGSILFPVFLNLLERVPFLAHVTDSTVLAAVYGGLIVGFGLGLIIRAGASSGGSDVVPIILSRKLGWPVAPMLYITDSAIMLLQLPFADADQVLFGILITLIMTLTLNQVILFGNKNVQFTIISPHFEKINACLQKDLDVGTTLVKGRTGHCNNPVDVILCVVTNESVQKVKDYVLAIDPEAFLTMVNVSGVNGRGFTMARRY